MGPSLYGAFIDHSSIFPIGISPILGGIKTLDPISSDIQEFAENKFMCLTAASRTLLHSGKRHRVNTLHVRPRSALEAKDVAEQGISSTTGGGEVAGIVATNDSSLPPSHRNYLPPL